MNKRYLTLVGDPNDINVWSNIPYFFLKAGKEGGFLDRGLPLCPGKLKLHRVNLEFVGMVANGRKRRVSIYAGFFNKAFRTGKTFGGGYRDN